MNPGTPAPAPEPEPAPGPGPGPGPDADEERILTPREVARLFRVAPRTVTGWARTGKLSSFRTLGGAHRYYASEVEQRLRDGGRDR